MKTMPVERRFIETPSGKVHCAQCGAGPALLLLHQTPRSWEEYREALPLLGKFCRAIAMDTRGFGDSDQLPSGEISIEGWAAAALELMDALEIETFAAAGHHTGAVIAMELAASAPHRIERLILSAVPYVDAARRAAHAGKTVVDNVERSADGSHLMELWQQRQHFYPEGRPDLLEAFVKDALKAGPMMSEGHRVVNRYRMEDRIHLVRCPTIILSPTDDPHTRPVARRVSAAIASSRVQEIPGAMIPFPDQMPEVFAEALTAFLVESGYCLQPSGQRDV